MKRRDATGAILTLGSPLHALAQAERLRKIGILVPTPGDSTRYASFLAAMRKLGWIEGQNLALEWRYVEARYDRVTAMTQELINAGSEVIVTNSTPAVVNARKASSTVPIVSAAFGQSSEFVAAGFLASYGPDFNASFATTASFVSRILRGAKPADLPIEQVTKLELAVSIRTAKGLGLTIPQSVLLRADEVIG